MRKDEGILLHIRSRDCVALEARYHKRCYQRYTKCLSNRPTEIGNTTYDKAFDKFCSEVIEERILRNKEVLLLSFLLKRFVACINHFDQINVSYQAARLKKRIQNRYPQIVFHPSRTMNKGTLVYSDSIAAGEIADEIIDVYQEEYGTEDENDDDLVEESGSIFQADEECSLQELYRVALHIKKLIKESTGVSSWPPDSHDLTNDMALQTIPTILFNFIAWSLGYSLEPSVESKAQISSEEQTKVLSIAQDMIYAESKGKKQTQKSLALGMTVRQVSGSIRLLKILHGLGHSASPATVYKHDTALSLVYTSNEEIVIPRNICSKLFATIVWDNNDFREETLTGRGTTHVANGIVIQKGSSVLRERIVVSKKIRTIKAPETTIVPYLNTKKDYLHCMCAVRALTLMYMNTYYPSVKELKLI